MSILIYYPLKVCDHVFIYIDPSLCVYFLTFLVFCYVRDVYGCKLLASVVQPSDNNSARSDYKSNQQTAEPVTSLISVKINLDYAADDCKI